MTPGEELVKNYEKLRLRLNKSGTERTIGLKDKLGDDCDYYKRSLSKFLAEDYIDLRNISYEIVKLITMIEGKNG